MRTQTVKSLFFIFVVFCFIELLARYLYILFPFENFNRYGWTVNYNYKFKVNERGALGELYRGQKIQIAFFGNSSLFDNALNNKTLPERLKSKIEDKIGEHTIHVDNFSIGQNDYHHILKQLQSLCRIRRFYNIAVIQKTPIKELFLDIKGGPSPYHKRWWPNHFKILQTGRLLKKWYKRTERNKFPFYSLFPKRKTYFSTIQNNLPEIRHNPLFQDLFVDYQMKLTEKSKKEISRAIAQISQKTTCITNKLVWMIPYYLWSEKMLKSYTKKQTYMWKVPKNNTTFQNILLRSPRTLGQYIFKENQFVKRQLKKYGISFIDLFSFMQQQITTTPDLFVDEYHVSEKGFEYMANYIYPEFEKILSAQVPASWSKKK